MPLPAEFTAPDPDAIGEAGRPPFPGARWACGLAATLLASFALTLALRSLPSDEPARAEKIVQQPITPEASAAALNKSPDLTAPDPGDASP